MSGSVNKVILIGNLGADPEVRYTPSSLAVANFSIATTEKWRNKSTQEMESDTQWHKIVCFSNLAELCGEWLTKGQSVYIEGRLQTRDWDDKDGVKRWTTEVVASKVVFLSPKNHKNGAGKPTNNIPPQFGGPGADDGNIPF